MNETCFVGTLSEGAWRREVEFCWSLHLSFSVAILSRAWLELKCREQYLHALRIWCLSARAASMQRRRGVVAPRTARTRSCWRRCWRWSTNLSPWTRRRWRISWSCTSVVRTTRPWRTRRQEFQACWPPRCARHSPRLQLRVGTCPSLWATCVCCRPTVRGARVLCPVPPPSSSWASQRKKVCLRKQPRSSLACTPPSIPNTWTTSYVRLHRRAGLRWSATSSPRVRRFPRTSRCEASDDIGEARDVRRKGACQRRQSRRDPRLCAFGTLRQEAATLVDGMLETNEVFFKAHGEPLFPCHMLDLFKEPGEENIEICASFWSAWHHRISSWRWRLASLEVWRTASTTAASAGETLFRGRVQGVAGLVAHLSKFTSNLRWLHLCYLPVVWCANWSALFPEWRHQAGYVLGRLTSGSADSRHLVTVRSLLGSGSQRRGAIQWRVQPQHDDRAHTHRRSALLYGDLVCCAPTDPHVVPGLPRVALERSRRNGVVVRLNTQTRSSTCRSVKRRSRWKAFIHCGSWQPPSRSGSSLSTGRKFTEPVSVSSGLDARWRLPPLWLPTPPSFPVSSLLTGWRLVVPVSAPSPQSRESVQPASHAELIIQILYLEDTSSGASASAMIRTSGHSSDRIRWAFEVVLLHSQFPLTRRPTTHGLAQVNLRACASVWSRLRCERCRVEERSCLRPYCLRGAANPWNWPRPSSWPPRELPNLSAAFKTTMLGCCISSAASAVSVRRAQRPRRQPAALAYWVAWRSCSVQPYGAA